MMARKKAKKIIKAKKSFFEPKHIVYLLIFVSLSVGFVYSRMRGVELQYQVNKIVKKIENEVQTNKKLKAQKADLMSVRNLKKIASKFDLKEPTQKQIIVIPRENVE